VLASLAAPPRASAEWHLAPFAGVKFGGSTTLIDLDAAAGDKKLVYGGTVTWLGRGIFGVEGDVSVVPNYLEADSGSKVQSSQVSTLMGNIVVTAPLGWTRESLRPYASGGAGVVRAAMDDSFNVFNYRRNLGGYNVGGGVVGFVTPFTGVKWDVRYFRAWGPAGEGTTLGSARLNFWRATMAIVFRY
jgi:hypothetical protein